MSSAQMLECGGRHGERFRRQFLDREPLIGTFFKTPAAYQQLEILGTTGLDCVALDAEHAPFDRSNLDMCVLSSRTVQLPVLVRVPESCPDIISSALDMGAAGVIVPHVRDATAAARLASHCRFSGGDRSLSGSHRAAGYGCREIADYLQEADQEVSLVCQIEDESGVDNVSEIAGVSGVDGLFIGPVDLAAALGTTDLADQVVDEAISYICAMAEDNQCPVGMYLPSPALVPTYRKRGVSLFMIGSDQSLVRGGAEANVKRFRETVT